jgi:hypothetical protein
MPEVAQKNFREWFVDVLGVLNVTPGAGFSVIMISLALLERYLREKSGSHEETLNSRFYIELLRAFPEFPSEIAAKDFWQVYRNGLLHQVALSLRNKRGDPMPLSGLRDDVDAVEVTPEGQFWVNPSKFSERVLDTILVDFTSFLGELSPNHPLPTVGPVSDVCLGTAAPQMWKKGAFEYLKKKR